MKIFKLMLLFLNIASFSIYLKAGPWAEKMGKVVNTLIDGKPINIDKIFQQSNLDLIEKNWDIISSYTVSKNNYQGIAVLLCGIFRVAYIKTTEDVFFTAKRILRNKTEFEQDYKKEFEYLLEIIQQKTETIAEGLHAFKKAQEAVAYYNANGEWPYDDYVGGYTVDDFLNEEDPEGVEELKTLEKKEDVKFVSTFVPMSESSSDSVQDSMKNSKEASPEKENPQSRIPDLMETENQ